MKEKEKKNTMAKAVIYGKTPAGRLLYDLAFAKLTDKWIARKHEIPVHKVRLLRKAPELKKLTRHVFRKEKAQWLN